MGEVVWADAEELGCGMVYYKDGNWFTTLVVCNYAPAGNMIGAAMYKVGEACSECPSGYECDDGLCYKPSQSWLDVLFEEEEEPEPTEEGVQEGRVPELIEVEVSEPLEEAEVPEPIEEEGVPELTESEELEPVEEEGMPEPIEEVEVPESIEEGVPEPEPIEGSKECCNILY